MAIRNFSNTAPPVSLSIGVNTTAVTLTVASTAGYPSAPFLLGLERGTNNEEVVLCTATTSTTFTVQRGYDGTSAKAHGIGASVEHTVAAIDYREANTHVNTPHNIGNALPQPGTPANSRVGDVASTGVAVEPARADHVHSREPFGSPVASTPGDAGSDGVSTSVARSDHQHPRESYATQRDNIIPAGTIMAYAGSTVPVGWVACGGQVMNRNNFARLYSAIGTIYGAGDGSTTFNVPDLRGRVPVGLDSMAGQPDTNRISQANFGSTRFIMGTGFGVDMVQLDINSMPIHSHGNDAHNHSQNAHNHAQDPHNHAQDAHSHGVNDPGHRHDPPPGGYQWVIASPFAEQHYASWINVNNTTNNTQLTYTNLTAVQYTGIGIYATQATNQANYATIYPTTATNNASTINIQNTGNGAPHLNIQPSIILQYIIKT